MTTLYEFLTQRIEEEEIKGARVAADRFPLPDNWQLSVDICRYKADAIRNIRDCLAIETSRMEV